jgi:hypothetical protein
LIVPQPPAWHRMERFERLLPWFAVVCNWVIQAARIVFGVALEEGFSLFARSSATAGGTTP